MANPNTFRQTVREETERAINRRLEQNRIDESDLDAAAEEWSLDSYDKFFADCREAGEPTSRCGALWTRLKERGDVSTGGSNPEGSSDDDTPESAMPSLPVPDSVEELGEQLRNADQAFLIVTTGCPSCAQAEEALEDWIDEGVIEVLNVQESDKAADVVIETGLDALPAMVLEDDGEFITI